MKRLIKIYFFLTALVLGGAGARAITVDPAVLDQKITEFIRAYQTTPDTGIALGLIQNGKVVYSRTFGFRDRAQKLPVTEHTRFAIGSNTKSFTSASLALLRDRGLVDLHSPVRAYLPDFTLSDEKISNEVTLQDVLSHQTGLPRHDLMWYLTPFSRDDLFSRLRYLPFNSDPAMGFENSFQYNNLMYMVAGRVVEKMSGESWEKFVGSEFFDRLAMTESNVTVAASEAGDDYAHAYLGELELPLKDMTNLGPAGAINASLLDMETWVLMYLNHGRDQAGRSVLSAAMVEALGTPLVDASAEMLGAKVDYGMGWFINEIEGKKTIWHGGNIDGFCAHMSYLPEENLGLVVLVNQTHAAKMEYPVHISAQKDVPDVYGLPLVIYESLLNPALKITLPAQTTPPAAPSIPAIPMPPSVAEYVGSYVNPGYGTLRVILENDHLKADYYGHAGELTAVQPDAFYFKFSVAGESSAVPLAFKRTDAKITSVLSPLEPHSKPIEFLKQSAN